jgi:hypothetical protein
VAREAKTDIKVVEQRDTPLVGMEVLEALDLWVDTQNGKLMTNPESPDMPIYNLYNIEV